MFIGEIQAELTAANIIADPSTVHRTVQRLREQGYISCLGHGHTQAKYLSRKYCLTRSGRRAARQRKDLMQRLLDTPPQDLLAEAAS